MQSIVYATHLFFCFCGTAIAMSILGVCTSFCFLYLLCGDAQINLSIISRALS
uniref:Uncharacterized protein n=1 Tax=Octopus bimaculoides TaxID=37653 RepID=A0A0L8G9X5_OCTBM